MGFGFRATPHMSGAHASPSHGSMQVLGCTLLPSPCGMRFAGPNRTHTHACTSQLLSGGFGSELLHSDICQYRILPAHPAILHCCVVTHPTPYARAQTLPPPPPPPPIGAQHVIGMHAATGLATGTTFPPPMPHLQVCENGMAAASASWPAYSTRVGVTPLMRDMVPWHAGGCATPQVKPVVCEHAHNTQVCSRAPRAHRMRSPRLTLRCTTLPRANNGLRATSDCVGLAAVYPGVPPTRLPGSHASL